MYEIPGKKLSDCWKFGDYLEHPLVLDLAAEVQVHLDHEESVPDAGESLECEIIGRCRYKLDTVDIVTSSGPGQNCDNIRYLSQGNKLYCPIRKSNLR